MPFEYNSQRHQYIDLDNDEPVPISRILSALQSQRNLLNSRISEIASSLSLGEINNAEWLNLMRSSIKDAYIGHYLAGRGGRNNMLPSDWGRIGGLLSSQYRYLGRFQSDISSLDLTEAQIFQRAKMYIESSTQAFERAAAADRNLILPAYPGDGTSECLSNCRCHWRISERRTSWEATWVLSAAEHCDTCQERARLWAPLIIEKDF